MTDITRNGISATDANTDLSITGNGTGVPDLESGFKVNGTVETLTGVAPGTSGNVLTSNGSAWTSAAAAGGGALVFISSATASVSSSITLTGLDGTYDSYMIRFSGLVNSADSIELKMKVGTGSTPTIQSNNYFYMIEKMSSFNGTTNMQSENNVTTGMNVTGNVRSLGTAPNSCGFINIYSPSDTTVSTVFDVYGSATHGGSYTKTHQMSGHWQSTTAVTAIQLFPTSGTITSGTFTLYGVANS